MDLSSATAPSPSSSSPSSRLPFRILALLLSALIVVAALRAAVRRSHGVGAAAGRSGAAVVVEGRTVIEFRASVMGYSPAERARSVERRIQGLVDAGALGAVTTADEPPGKVVKIGDRVAFAVFPEDPDAVAGETVDGVAAAAARTLDQALRDETEGRSLATILFNAAYAVLATAAYAGLLVVLRRGARWVGRRMNSLADPQLALLARVGFRALSAALVRGGRAFLKGVAWVLALAMTYAWLAFVLSRFPYTRAIGDALAGFLTNVVSTVALDLLNWLPGLAFVAVIFTATYFVNRGVKLFFDAVEAGAVRMPQAIAETAQPTRRLVSVCVWIFAVVQAYPYLPGSGTDAFKGISVFVGLLVSLGGSGVMGHATSGLVLMFSRALRPGDYIRVGEHEGTVVSMGTLSTKVRTPWLEEVNVPNLLLASNAMINYSRAARGDGVVLHTSVTIGYDTPWRQVQALLERAAARTPGLRPTPAPYVLQRALSDFYVEYELCAHLAQPEDRVKTLAALHAAIQDAFNEEGVQIMSPHYLGDPAQAKVVPPERWEPTPARAGAPEVSTSRGRT